MGKNDKIIDWTDGREELCETDLRQAEGIEYFLARETGCSQRKIPDIADSPDYRRGLRALYQFDDLKSSDKPN